MYDRTQQDSERAWKGKRKCNSEHRQNINEYIKNKGRYRLYFIISNLWTNVFWLCCFVFKYFIFRFCTSCFFKYFTEHNLRNLPTWTILKSSKFWIKPLLWHITLGWTPHVSLRLGPLSSRYCTVSGGYERDSLHDSKRNMQSGDSQRWGVIQGRDLWWV
jgi:hypothetical protein